MISDELRKARLQRARNFAEGKVPVDEQVAAITKKADDLDALQKAVSDATSVGAPLWISYIFLMFYIAIAAGAVTHVDLLLERPIKLPFLTLELPLKAFFIVAPLLFLIDHAYVLAHFVMLAEKAKAFHDSLTRKIGPTVPHEHDIREGVRTQLPINVFVQFLAGRTRTREGGFGVLLWVIAWTTLAGAPVALLLLVQLQFLPYHDTYVTWWHRVILIADLCVIWWLWLEILKDRGRTKPQSQTRGMKLWDLRSWSFRKHGARAVTAVVVTFSVLVATFPGERKWTRGIPSPLGNWIALPTEFVFGKVDVIGGDSKDGFAGGWPANTLHLRDFDLYDSLNIKDIEKFNLKPYIFILIGRRLEHADLQNDNLKNVDLARATLDGAVLTSSVLTGSSLIGASLRSALLWDAQLQGVAFHRADLTGSKFREANLMGASFIFAEADATSFQDANLQNTFFFLTKLRGAGFWRARMQGSALHETKLQGAQFSGAHLEGASLWRTSLWRTDFGSEYHTDEPKPIRLLEADLTPLSEGEFQQITYGMPPTVPSSSISILNPNINPNYTPRIPLLKNAILNNKELFMNDFYSRISKILCGAGGESIYILRRKTESYIIDKPIIASLSPNVSLKLINLFLSPSCSLSNYLTESDKSALYTLAGQVEAESVPSLESQPPSDNSIIPQAQTPSSHPLLGPRRPAALTNPRAHGH